jgi:hypothetical protein
MPDTLNYLYLGLASVAVLSAGYVVSLVLRWRNLQQDIQMLEQLNED